MTLPAELLAGMSGLLGIRPKAAPGVLGGKDIKNYKPSADASFNDHSTRDRWMSLIGGISPALAPFASQVIHSDQARNASHDAAMVRLRQQAALSGAMQGGQFDPNAYLQQHVTQGLDAPSIEDIGRLEDMGGKRQDRQSKADQEHRTLIGAVLAPLARVPAEQRNAYRDQAHAALVKEGIPEDEANYVLSDLSDPHISEWLSMGIGGDKYLDNARQDAAQTETVHHNQVEERLGQGGLDVSRGNLSVSQGHLELARHADARAAASAAKPKGTPGLPVGFVLDPH